MAFSGWQHERQARRTGHEGEGEHVPTAIYPPFFNCISTFHASNDKFTIPVNCRLAMRERQARECNQLDWAE
jgi:hypothetical protein